MSFDKPVRINGRTWEHVLAATQRIEAMPYPSRQPVFFPRFGGGSSVFDAISTSTITPFNSNTNTYGQGTCHVLAPIYNSNTNTYVASVNGTYGNTNSTLLLNGYTNNGNSINSGVKLTVGWCGGTLLLIGADQC